MEWVCSILITYGIGVLRLIQVLKVEIPSFLRVFLINVGFIWVMVKVFMTFFIIFSFLRFLILFSPLF